MPVTVAEARAITARSGREQKRCNATSAGCFYDSLNIAAVEPWEKSLTVGSNPTEAFDVNSTGAEMYCGNRELVGQFVGVSCTSMYEGDHLTVEVEAVKK